MNLREWSGTTARRALWFAGLLVLLAGIVGMHGLNSHAGGTAPHVRASAMDDPGFASASEAAVTTAHGTAASVEDLASSAAVVGAALLAGMPGMDAGMAGMCMAVLAAAFTMLLRLLGSAPMLPLYRLVGAPARALGPHGRDPDPPSLISLSIRRC